MSVIFPPKWDDANQFAEHGTSPYEKVNNIALPTREDNHKKQTKVYYADANTTNFC